ncbi:RNA polymerase sigma factor RpoD, partial [bacterium]|nr:RNA polymerase sigma factor RpoD [bacterium]
MAKKSSDEVKQQLVDIGKEKGFLTYDEVNDVLPPDFSTEQIDDVMSMFGEMDIDLVDSSQKVKIPKMKLDLEEEEEIEGEQEEMEYEPGVLGRTSDPVRMYLREMGSVSLLTREGEVEIAKRIEEGERDIARVILTTPITVKEIIALGDKLRKFQISAAEISKEVEEEELEEDEEDVQANRVLSIIDEIRELDVRMEAIVEELEAEGVAAKRQKELLAEQQEIRDKFAELVKSLRLKDRHITRIAQRLKELSGKVEAIMAEIAGIEAEAGGDATRLKEVVAKGDAKAKGLKVNLEEAQKLEKRIRSAEKKLKKLEHESGFKAQELSDALHAIDRGEI